MKSVHSTSIALAAALALAASTVNSALADSAFSSAAQAGDQIVWQSAGHWSSVRLRVTGAAIQPFETEFKSSEAIALPLNSPNGKFPDGIYNWELVGAPVLSANMAKARAEFRASSDENPGAEFAQVGKLAEGAVASGTFRILKGAVVKAGATEPSHSHPSSVPRATNAPERASAVPTPGPITPDDQVTADDLIVQGSLGVGFDSTDGENFGFSTILLRENNLRITFDDTSAATGFAANDWELAANDSSSGGQNYFAINDLTGGKVPFKVLAGAPSNSLFADSTGKIGLGTSTPLLKLHLQQGNTPAIRLEQDASDVYTAQTWDVAGNEANFFVRDVTGGSRLPFRIRPGAPTSSIDIAANGDVGFGTASPASSLHVSRGDGTAKMTIEETNATNTKRDLIRLRNNGATSMRFLNTAASADAGGGGWEAGAIDGLTFALKPAKATPGLIEFQLQRGGQLTITGPMYASSFNTTSDRNLKERVVPIAPREVLQRVVEMPIEEWSFIGEASAGRHIGPMAQDFREQFGLGDSETTINVMDSAGVALAAIQGLHEEVASRDAEIKTLRENGEALAAQLRSLSQQVEALRTNAPAAAEPSL